MSAADLLLGADLLLIVGLLVCLAVIGWRDGRSFTISLLDCAVLLALSVALKLTTGFEPERFFAEALFALGLGIGCAVIIPASRALSGRAWLCEGDVWLFFGLAFLLGPRGFALAAIMNLPLALAWRLWRLRKKRAAGTIRTRLFASYAPVAPSFCLAAALVLLNQVQEEFRDVG